MNTIKLTQKEKIAYGLGDTGCNLVWQTVMLFLAYFYTDVYGLSPAHMGTMFLLVRFIDAVTDPIMGGIVDRTKSKHGKYRPYMLWVAVPFGIACLMVFYTPDIGETGKVIYAYISYITLTIMYTAINVPYCAMANTLTNDSDERTSLQSYRFALSTVGGLIVAMVALPLVDVIGQGDKQLGYLGAMSIMGLGAIGLFIICFKNVKERVSVEPDQKSSVKENIQLFKSNKPWVVIFILNIVLLAAVVLKGGSTLYYVNTVMEREDLATFVISIGMVAAIIGALISPILLKGYDKVKAYQTLTVISGLLSCSIFFISPQNPFLVIAVMVVLGVIQMMTTPILWSMMSDVVDYEKTKSSRNVSGIVFASVLFAIKLGIAIGGAMIGWLLAFTGYDGQAAAQPEAALTMINLLFSFIPGVMFIALAGIMHFYPLHKPELEKIKALLSLEGKEAHQEPKEKLHPVELN
ncbi:MAG: glycoside-pentoside-hexuronide (GPH):cation symporter [Vibrio sp.]